MIQSTVWVDSRVGSKEMLTALRKQGLPAELTTLDAGDFAFEGHGPDGQHVSVGIERKTIMDLVSSLRSGRLQGTSHDQHSQLDRLHKTYDLVWLLVEGSMGGDRRFGKLMKSDKSQSRLPGGYTEDSLTKALLSLELRGGMRIKQTASVHNSVIFIGSLFRWFTDKQWDDHSTLHAPLRRESIMPLSMFRDIVMRFPGIGIAMSLAVEKYCMVETPDGKHPSVTRLLSMNLSDWENLEEPTKQGPRKFGVVRAGRVLEAVRKLR